MHIMYYDKKYLRATNISETNKILTTYFMEQNGMLDSCISQSYLNVAQVSRIGHKTKKS